MKHISRKISLLIGSLLLMLMTPVSAFALENPQELQFSGGFFLARGDAATGTAQLQISYGYYFTPNWQLGIRLLASYSLNDPIEDVRTASTTGYFNYYFWADRPDQKLQPFVGAFIGMAYSDVDTAGTAGPTVGLKYYVSDRTYLVGQYQYEAYFSELKAGAETNDFDTGNHAVTMGMGFRW